MHAADKGYPRSMTRTRARLSKAENAYFDAAMKPHRRSSKRLFQEIRAASGGDAAVHLRDGDYLMVGVQPGTQYRLWYASQSRAAPTSCCSTKMPGGGQGIFRSGSAGHPDGKRLATLVDATPDASTRRAASPRQAVETSLIASQTPSGQGFNVCLTEVNDQWRSYRPLHVIGGRSRAETTLRGEGRHRFLGRVNRATTTV